MGGGWLFEEVVLVDWRCGGGVWGARGGGEKGRVVERVGISRVATTVGRVYVRTGRFLSPSVSGTLGTTATGRRSPLNGGVLGRLRRGLGVTNRSVVPVYRSAKVTIFFVRVNRSIRFVKNMLRSTVGRKIERNCASNCLEGSIMGSPLVERGAGSGAPTIVRCSVISNSGIGVAFTPGKFKDRGVDHMFVLGPTSNVRKMGGTVLATISSTKPGTYPPVIIKIKINKAFRGYTVVTGGTLAERTNARSSVRCITRLRGRVLRGVGGLNVKPKKLNKDAATLTMGVGACPARVTKLPITMGVYYRMGHRMIGRLWEVAT